MRYTNVTSPTWNIDSTMIDCQVTFEVLGVLPFTASPNDTNAHGREIYARCIAGDFGPVAEYVPAPDEGPQLVCNLAPNQPPTVSGAQTL
jgi:hypothetical protein